MSALSICPTAVWALNGTTIAGSSDGTAGSSTRQLSEPTTVIVDNSSNIYVADSGNFRVLLFRPTSNKGTLVINGSFGTEFNQFQTMDGMSIVANGNIYILDGTSSRVTKWTPGSASGILVAGGGPFIDYYDGHMDSMGESYGMFVDPQALFIWIADTDNSRIVKWVNSSTALTVCGSYGTNSDQFIYPLGLFVDTTAGNTLYVVDSGNHRIQRWLSGATSGITVAGITSYYGAGLNQLWDPSAILVDNNQNMYIVDSSNSRILRWKAGASSGVIITGSDPLGGVGSSQFESPNSISFSSNGTLYVADTQNNRIQRFAISCPTNISTTTVSSVTTMMPISTSNCTTTVWASNATTIAGSPIGIADFTSTLLTYPIDVWVGKNDSIYVMDFDTYYRVQVFYPGSQLGTAIFNASYGTDPNQFYYVNGLSIDVSGNIYVLDAGNSRVTKWAPGASTGILVAGGNGLGSSLNQMDYPYGFFVEPNTSYIWIVDTYNCRVVKWLNASTVVLVAGGIYGSNADQFKNPNGLFVDTSSSNTLYVADTYNYRIQKWLYGGSSGTTVAGQSGVYGSALNQLNQPHTLIMDTNGSMYIVDYGNSRIVLWLLGATSGILIAGSNTNGVLPDQLNYPLTVRFDSTGALIVNDEANNRIQRFTVLCSPNMTSSSTTSVLTSSTSIAATLQNTTMAVPLTTNSLATSTNSPTTILSASTSTLVTTSQKSSSTNTITKLSSTRATSSLSTNHSFATRNLNSKLLLLLFCFIMIFINN
ncbi:unnamed protein product [Adineta steineri]|uniref:NHL repeat containing protein-like protein n=1 Tax=Adineta steineri TaxID=433720 RepID=A0A815AA55_9BILA|nr:unnamed protein product [Adineta steineri]CAF3753469.1 unnamed protein product [Adineta steineri]